MDVGKSAGKTQLEVGKTWGVVRRPGLSGRKKGLWAIPAPAPPPPCTSRRDWKFARFQSLFILSIFISGRQLPETTPGSWWPKRYPQVTFRYLSVSGCEASQLNKKSAALGSLMVPPSATVEARAHGEPSKCPGAKVPEGGAVLSSPPHPPLLPNLLPQNCLRSWLTLPQNQPRCPWNMALPHAPHTRGLGGGGGRGRRWGHWLVPGPKPSSMIGCQSNTSEKPETRRRRFWSLPAVHRCLWNCEESSKLSLTRQRRKVSCLWVLSP